ncbi:erythroid differentiation-related factor 1 [Scaptodrosophila lebanonensis]|uniref:Erythroid differentiation-related factor 1 n=1 Tax=Drosophila lebanonensis TaxID=7225 RepID=A0A6J2T6B6_DROLE|nr:erythroid differentiation-related factor 1 [Scaptodrosophila lebanonensis]
MEDSNEEIEPCRDIGPHELVESVKSQAVIKLSQVYLPAHFKRLELQTNLNQPPLNWLTTSESSHGLHQALYQSAGFASFRLGQMFPDCVGQVDVVSDAENIKQLLKLPYSAQSAISMVVHKVGNTLLLDEFDIQKYLLRKADDDWKWLRTFILEHILAYGDKQHNYCLKERSREALQRKNLLSKFLYHSLKQTDGEELAKTPTQLTSHRTGLPLIGPLLPEPKIEENVPDPKSSHAFNRNVVWTFEDIRMLIGTDMPIFGGPNRPCISLRLRDAAQPINVLTGIDYWLDNLMCNVPEVIMCYHLDGIVQKYEIIKTEDLPYLENSQFAPQVVRNVAQNILAFLKANATKAGHTYWLFKGRNDDVVKLYDLTTLCQTQTAAAAAAAKEEAAEPAEHKTNPFTVPVGMLLYSVARNMKNTAEHISPKTAGNIRALLDNCIKLLPKEEYPQIVSSSHYILSDLHVPAGIDPKAPKFDELDSDTQSLYDDDEDEVDEEDDVDVTNAESLECDYGDSKYYQSAAQSGGKANVAVRHICDALRDFKSHTKQSKPAPLIASTVDRCNISLAHISAGISCLQYFNGNQEEKFIKESETHAKQEERQRILHEEQNPNMAKPFNAIPLPYETLKPTQNDAQLKLVQKQQKKSKQKRRKSVELQQIASSPKAAANNQQLSAKFNNQQFGSWNVHLKLLLLEKACLTYATLAEHHYEAKRYGVTLRAIELAYRCQQVVNKYMTNLVSQQSCLLGRAGDCFFQMSKHWSEIDEYLKQYEEQDESARIIDAELTSELTDPTEVATVLAPVNNMEQIMLLSCKCYEQALEHAQDAASNELLRRLGNVRNELALKYMYWAQEEYSKVVREREAGTATTAKAEEPLYVKLTVNSYDCLCRGIKAFTAVQDNVNLAFLYCNMGRFMRLRAHLTMPNESVIATDTQKSFYQEAFNYYEKAKDCLDTRKANPELWDLVHWELSTAMFTLAKQLQDFSAADKSNFAEASKEVLELLQKSLQLCDVEHAGARQILYTFRSGLIHKRIASFHYSQLRANCTDPSHISKLTLQLCKFHYEKATQILTSLKEVSDLLVVQLERISLQEFLTELSTHCGQKIKHMQVALDICLQCELIFSHVIETSSSENETNANASGNTIGSVIDEDEFVAHLSLYESRLQNALKTLIKLLLTGKDPKKLSASYKQMYMETLTGKHGIGAQQATLVERAHHLQTLLLKLKAMCDASTCASNESL